MLRSFRSVVALLCFLSSGVYADKNPLQWLEEMNHAYQNSNYSLSIMHLQRNHAQSFLFEHGVIDDDQIVYISSLTGPVSHSYRINNKVTYIDPEIQPYSVEADTIVMASPSLFVNKTDTIVANYHLSLAGKGRVAGRMSQVVRLKSKDKHRFNYVLWFDAENSLLLRYDSYDLDNNLVEQMQVINISLTEQPSEKLVKLLNADISQTTMAPQVNTETQWKFNWLPDGYQLKASDSHRLFTTSQATDYLMLSDGLSEISVYVARAGKIPFPDRVVTQGGVAVARHRESGIDITVVGKVPLETVAKIARSITLK